MLKSIDIQYLKHFLQFTSKYKSYTRIGLMMMPISIACNLAFPWLIIQVIDQHLSPKQFEGLPVIIFAMILVLVINYIADAFYSYYLRKTGNLSIFDMRMALVARILKFPRSYFDNTATGITLSRLTSDLETIGESFVLGILGLVKDSLNTIAILGLMFFINWQLTLVVILVFPPVLLLTRFVRNRLRALYLMTRSTLAKGTGYLQECLLGVKTVQLYAAQTEVEEKYHGFTEQFKQAQLKVNAYDAALFSIITGITSITIGLLIWYGSNEVLQGFVTLGVLIAFINTLEKIFVPIRDFSSQIASIQRSFAAFEHIEELFSQALEEDNRVLISSEELKTKLIDFQSLEFKEVRFRYKADGPYVLNGISFKLKQGEKLALVGTTGSGKSTIIRLLTKSYLDYEGSILLNGIELSAIPKQSISHLFSLMQQDVYLFDQDVQFNIALDKPLSLEQVQEAAKYVYAHEFIQSLPNQYQHQLKSGSSQLSAGQTQLISFARAVAKGSPLLMLDEATSSVDSVTEELIQNALSRLFKDKTVIAIAHRLSTIRHSDLILVMDKGRVSEQGKHAQLLALGGVYAGLLQEHKLEEAEQ
ncbi:ABC transporter ATP-binding protein [Alginatibacterium sediminis]|uniref:ABC transporter ATP-binding protein n=1 Tax=Alginatibacterium sediminis TaxID=2164068 RepID=A0A420EDX4_9ALTE|nr:ABC transporter ATP-binding protein [Alginatibacterium sediminis]RKF18868.1 ABC transporter ATP-binding protein [Alginatibacterium sediminis]